MIQNCTYINTKDWRLLLFALMLSLMAGCNFDLPKSTGNLKVQKAVSHAKSTKAVRLSSGPAFPFTKQATCCRGVPSRAHALAAKIK